MNSKTIPVLVVLLIIASFLVGKFYTEIQYLKQGNKTTETAVKTQPTQAQPTVTPPQPGTKVQVKIDTDDPVMGNKNAKVTVVEFADYQCPFCGALSGLNSSMVSQMQAKDSTWQPFGTNFIKDYVNTGKAKFVYKDFAFLDDGSDIGESQLSAAAALCAGDQNKYWEFHDYLYSHQQGENQGAFVRDKLKGFASSLGLDASKFNSCLDSKKYAQKVKNNTDYGRSLGVSGTPAVFINGQLLTGAQSYKTFKSLIESELGK